jgi:hypothetical protein
LCDRRRDEQILQSLRSQTNPEECPNLCYSREARVSAGRRLAEAERLRSAQDEISQHPQGVATCYALNTHVFLAAH